MPLKFLRDEVDESPAEARQIDQDLEWFSQHVSELSKQFPGMYVAVVQGETYAASTRLAAYNLAKEQQPDLKPLVFYIPSEKRLMVYDFSR